MHVWDKRFDWRHVERLIDQISASVCKNNSLSESIAPKHLAIYAFWIVYYDVEGRIESYVAKELGNRFGNPRQALREQAQKIDTLTRKIEKAMPLIPFLPVPPLRISEQLQDYAKQLREYAARPIEKRVKWQDRGTEVLQMLVSAVARETGRPHYRQVADLLTGTAEALGARTEVPGRDNETRAAYDVHTIKMRVKRARPRAAR